MLIGWITLIVAGAFLGVGLGLIGYAVFGFTKKFVLWAMCMCFSINFLIGAHIILALAGE